MFSGSLIGKSSCSIWYPKCATGYRTSAKCCHDAAGWFDSVEIGFSLYSLQPEWLLRNMELSQSLQLAAISCQSIVKPLSDVVPIWCRWGSMMSTYASPVKIENRNTFRQSSCKASDIGVSSMVFRSARLMCLCLGAVFFSYSMSSNGLAQNIS